jgi:glucose-1-phosphatase
MGRRMEEDGLFPAKWSPAEGELRLYANSLQRTIATSRSFIAGFLPLEDIPVEHHGALGTIDPVFSVRLRPIDSLFVQQALHEMDSLTLLYRDVLRENYPLLARVLDFDRSAAKAAGDTNRFRLDDIAFVLQEGEEPQVTGTLCWACRAADALTLQYYEETDNRKAGFGYRLTPDGWRRIASVKEVYQRLLFATPVIARHLAQPMLGCLKDELTVPGRRFTFLCGHDSNLLSVLSALRAEPYTLTGAVEADTPVSSQLILRRWTGVDGEDYADISLLYPTAEELRNGADLDRRNPPAEVSISLEGLDRNEDGLYRLEDVLDRMGEVICCHPCGNCGQIQNNFVN